MKFINWCENLGIGGRVVTKLISGIKVPGTRIRIRRESKVSLFLCLSTCSFLCLSVDVCIQYLRLLLTTFKLLLCMEPVGAQFNIPVYLGKLVP